MMASSREKKSVRSGKSSLYRHWKKHFHLPRKFETVAKTVAIRRWLFDGLKSLSVDDGMSADELGLPAICTTQKPCDSGLCPICFRVWRDEFLRFAYSQGWYRRVWIQITIRSDDWFIHPGDLTPFTTVQGIDHLTDIPALNVLWQRIYRAHKGSTSLIAIACVETDFETRENVDYGKPFHFHVMVTGLTFHEVSIACEGLYELSVIENSGMARPIHIKEVGAGKIYRVLDNRKALSYLIKQPFWRYSKFKRKPSVNGEKSKDLVSGQKASRAKKYGLRRQTPKSSQLAELANNLGPLDIRGRFKFKGFEYRAGSFRTTGLKSNQTAKQLRRPSK